MKTELSKREQAVLDLMAKGMHSGRIAKLMFISPKTVATYVSRICVKLGLSSSIALYQHAAVEEYKLSQDPRA